MDETPQAAAEVLAAAVAAVTAGQTRTRPVSMSLPAPLADALQDLAASGVIDSASAVTTRALLAWSHNELLRLSLDELYEQQPDLRPAPDRVREVAAEFGVALPTDVEVA